MKKTFEQLKISKSILRTLDDIGFKEPTAIQQKAIPVIRSGANMVGIARTGTGKTAAYLIPLLMNITKAEIRYPRVLVLVPTRELSIQVGDDIEELTSRTTIRYAAVYGGVGWTKQAQQIEPGVDILVATPGRLWELYQKGALSLKKIKYLVIDEADRMLDMGFMPQLRQLFEVLPHRRQNLLFSATFSKKVEQMAEEFLDFYQKIKISRSATPAERVQQEVYLVPNYRTKLNLVKQLLEDEKVYNRVLLFVREKSHAEAVFKVIKRKSEGEKRILHSSKGQTSRLNAINAFKAGEVRILISTDVSARGIDASLVSHVINFDLPLSYEDYVHRIGRTARAGNPGVAITLIDPSEEWHMKRIEKLIRMEIPRKEMPQGVEIVETTKEERQQQLREIDHQRKVEDPSFQGAFHERKKKKPTKRKQQKRKKNPAKRRG
jgi:ATP-dependent RNA helicase RhlE